MTDQAPLPDRLDSISLGPETPIMEAVEKLNAAHKRILVVVGDGARLLGVVTDSNIRRAVLDRHDFSRPISDLMVTKPIVVSPDKSDQHVLAIMERTQCYQIPVVDKDGRLTGIHYIDELLGTAYKQKERVAVVMAGGLGSRLLPLTENKPKPLLEVGDKPILFTVFDQLLAADFGRIYVTLNYQGQQIAEAVENESAYRDHVRFIREEQPLGTAGALTLMEDVPDEPFLVMNGDILTKVALTELAQFHERERNLVTMALKEQSYEVPYGVVELENTRVTGLHEKPSLPVLINAGVYIVDPITLSRIPTNKRWDMTDVIDDLIEAQLRVGGFPIHEYWIDIGEPSQLNRAKDEFVDHFADRRENDG